MQKKKPSDCLAIKKNNIQTGESVCNTSWQKSYYSCVSFCCIIKHPKIYKYNTKVIQLMILSLDIWAGYWVLLVSAGLTLVARSKVTLATMAHLCSRWTLMLRQVTRTGS